MNVLPSSNTICESRLIAIEQEYYTSREKLVGSSIDWATTKTAIDIWLIVTSQLFVLEIYNSQEVVWNEYTSLYEHYVGK